MIYDEDAAARRRWYVVGFAVLPDRHSAPLLRSLRLGLAPPVVRVLDEGGAPFRSGGWNALGEKKCPGGGQPGRGK